MRLFPNKTTRPRSPVPATRGQAAIEFTMIAPIVIALFLLMIKIALIWHGHHLAGQLSLEGASTSSARSNQIASSWMPGYQIRVSSVAPFDPNAYLFKGDGLVLTTYGVEPIFTFLGATNDGDMSSETAFPVWEFVP